MANIVEVKSPEQTREELSDEEKAVIAAAYSRDGFAVVRDVLPRERLLELKADLLSEFERSRSAGMLFTGGGLMSGHINCFPGEESRFVYDELDRIGLIALVRKMFPKATGLPNVGCNFNLPGSVPQHYHADRPFTRDFIIINIALVDTEIVNGAIDVLPETHTRFYPYWRFGLQRLYRKTTRLPMKAGDILIRSSNLWHRGMPNYSTNPRPMMALTWEDGGTVLDDPFQDHDGKIAFIPNWFRPTLRGRIRERIFVKAPILYSTYRFVDSIVSNKGY